MVRARYLPGIVMMCALLAHASVAYSVDLVPVNKCLAGKVKAVGKSLAARAKCHAKDARQGIVDPSCVYSASEKFVAGKYPFFKLEAKYPATSSAPCLTFDDRADLDAALTGYAADIAAAVGQGASKCDEAKIKCTGKYFEAIAKCASTAAKKGGIIYSACLGAAASKFGNGSSGCLDKATRHADCTMSGSQLGSLKPAADAFLDDTLCTLVPGHAECAPPPTVTPTSTPGTPTPSATATPVALCGDGVVNGNEECDPPASSACPGQCTLCRCPGSEPSEATVRIAYLIPSNRTPQPLFVENFKATVPMLHEWWCEQMDRYGFGAQSFRYERDVDGVTPVVHVVAVDDTDAYLRADIFGRGYNAAAVAGVPVGAAGQVWLLVPEAHQQQPDSSVLGGVALGTGYGSGLSSGIAMVAAHFHMIGTMPAALSDDTLYQGLVFPEVGPVPAVQDVFMPWFEGNTVSSLNSSHMGGAIHEVGHALGLQHDRRNEAWFYGPFMGGNGLRGIRGTLIPGAYPTEDADLTYAAGLALRYSRYLEPCTFVPPITPSAPATSGSSAILPRTVGDETVPSLNVLTTGTVNPAGGLVEISFTASDAGGLSSALLFRSGDTEAEIPLSGTSATATFRTERYNPGIANTWVVWVYDRNGNHAEVVRTITPASGFNRAPIPTVKVLPSQALIGDPIVLDATASNDPDGHTPLLVEWDLNGDGIFDTAPTTTPTLTVSFPAPAGTRLIRARVTDTLGAQSVSTPLAVRTTDPNVSAPNNWSSGFIAAWNLDQVSGTRPATGGTAGTACDLTTDFNAVASDAVNKREGARAASFDHTQNEYLGTTTCGPSMSGVSNGYTLGCWARPTVADAVDRYLAGATDSISFAARSATAKCVFANLGVDPIGHPIAQVQSGANTMPVDTFTHTVCRFDDAGNALSVLLNGSPAASVATTHAPGAPGTNLTLSGGALNDFDGQLDECFVSDHVLTDAEICRICSCQIDGTLCACTSSNPTLYASTGRNGACGNCALPACNAPSPS